MYTLAKPEDGPAKKLIDPDWEEREKGSYAGQRKWRSETEVALNEYGRIGPRSRKAKSKRMQH